jgi:gliding motility-associated-like protein
MKIHLNAIKLTFVFMLVLWVNDTVYGQLSKVHYIPPISISEEQSNNEPLEQWIYISTPNNSSVQYVITPLGGGAEIIGLVSNNVPAKHTTKTSSDNYDTQLVVPNVDTGFVLANKGYIIESDEPIYVSLRLASSAQAGALVSKGVDALGQEFLLGSFSNITTLNNGLANFFSVLATENNTVVKVEFPNTVTLENYSGSYPITINLNKNESYVGLLDVSAAIGNQDGLLGAKITSDKPIAVNTGSASGTNGNGGSRDFGIDQIVDTRFAGNEYIFIRGVGEDSWENVMIVPTQPNTSIEINGSLSIPISGAYYEIDGNMYNADGNMFVRSDKPVVAYQGIGGDVGSEANQGMFYVPPLSCSSRGNVDNIPLINEIGTTSLNGSPWRGAIGIVAKTGADVLVNDAILTSGTVVDANRNYTTYLINNLQDQTYSIKSNDELYVSYYNYSGFATSGSFYSGFVSNPLLQNDLAVTSLGTCVKNDGSSNTRFTTFSSYDSYQWQVYNDATGSYEPGPGTNNQEFYEPTVPGRFRLLGKLDCFPTKDYISDVIVVSLCPNDFDDDGIPDTIDLDRDNDGVLNSFESLGNASIDFSDPATPSIILPDDLANAILSTGSTTTTSAGVSGNSNGEITSMIPFSGLNEKTTYALNPILPTNEALNIRLSEVLGSTSSEFETITLFIYPTTENITLLDLGQKLLVDNGTGFKRIPKEGVSGNQIKFKYNPSPLDGGIPFEILGVNITGIDIVHELGAMASSSAELNILMEIVDYDVDTDGDTIIDALDNDSDADGCPDKSESGLEDLLPPPPFTFNAGTVDARGRIILTGNTSPNYPDPKRNASGDFLFLTPGTPVTINTADQPQNNQISEGDTTTFRIGTMADNYQWQMYDPLIGGWINITDSSVFSGTTTQTLTVNTTDTSLNGKKFSVLVHSNTYLCETPSAEATLSVLALPPIPVLNRVYSFCGTGTVTDLKGLIDPTKTFNVYDEETGGTALLDTDALIDGEDYYVTEVNAAGGESVIRSFTNVVVTNPTLSADAPTNEICLGESVTLTATGVPYTVSEFEDSLDPSFEYITTYTDPVTSEVSHYFLKKESMTWTAARNLIKSLGSGASMYVINSTIEEEHVYREINPIYKGGADEHFWLGLRQIDVLANGKFDQGWVWLDGRPLDVSDWAPENPWASIEPNDYDYSIQGDPISFDSDGIDEGSEDYAQFDYGSSTIKWNDMANDGGGGNSWPIFEFQGVTQVKWYKQEPGKTKEEIVGETSNTLTITPTVKGNITYSYEILVNGVPCPTNINIYVNELPDINLFPADDMPLCDNNLDGDPTNTNKAEFDLQIQRTQILLNSGITDRDVFFYDTNTKALSVSDSIPSTTPFINTLNPQTIHYRIKNTVTGCFSDDIGTFYLIINDLPPILSIDDLHECDDNITGNDKDGLHEFDLTQKDSDVNNALIALGKDPADYTWTYHALENDTIPITTYTTLPIDNSEKEIFVRIQDNKGCVRYDNSFKVIVDKLPDLKITTLAIEQCESDGEIKYDLNNAAPLFSDNYENEEFAFFEDAALNVPILKPESFTTSVDKKVYLKIRNEDSGCVRSDDIAMGASNIIINLIVGINIPPSSFTTLSFDPYCFDASISTTPGYGAFDPSIFEDMATALIAEDAAYGDPSIEISFFESDEDASYQRNKIATYSNGVLDRSTPYTTISTNYDSVTHTYSQEIWAGIEDLSVSNVKCLGRLKVANLTIVPEITFDVPPGFVYCKNEGPHTISIQNPIPDIPYTYTWTRNGSLISGETSKNLPITDGGTYVVFATNPNTGCSSTPREIKVFPSESAAFDSEDVTVFDLTGNGTNRIEIINTEVALGIGDYEFRLNDNPYQDSPIFEHVPPGIHTLYVNDKNGCDKVELDVSVIGYPLFFTPNGDNQNDTWQILGVNATFQALSLIYIFDRHGRLMAQIPADGTGWDGTYNGAALPADDYWFRVKLEDGRSFTGHFSLIR